MSNSRKVMARLLLTTVLALWAAVEFPAFATNLTGTFKSPDGSLVNGKLIFLLSQPARLNDSTAQIVPMVKIFSVSNGALESGAFIYGNDVLVPSGTYYLVRLVDNNNNLLFEQKWSIQGTNLDLGTLTPTTSGVVLADPLVKNTGTNQSVQGPVTFTSGLTALNLTLNGNLNPGTADSYDLGTTAAPWRQIITKEVVTKGPRPWYDVRAYGAIGNGSTNDTPAFQAAINACQANGGGGDVYVAPSPNFAYYRILTQLTLATPPQGRNCRLLLANGIHINVGLVLPRGWHIEGVPGANGAGAFMSDYHGVIAAETGTITGAVIKLNAASSSSLKNIQVVWNGTSSAAGIWIAGGANYQLRNVASEVSLSDTTNYALLIEGPAQQVEIYNSVFTSGNQVTSKPSIRIYGVPGQTCAGNVFIYDSVLQNHGISNESNCSSSFGGMVLFNVLHEAVMSATVQVDSTGAAGARWTFIGGGQSDLAAATAKPLWEHTAGAFPVGGLTFIGVEEPNGIGYYVDNSVAAARITDVTIIGALNNGITMRPPNSRLKAANLPLVGWSSSILTATPSETFGAGGLIGGQLNVGMQFPENVAVTGFITGGTLAVGNFFYVVSALNGINSPFDNAFISSGTPYESWISQEVSCNVASGTTGRCDLTWNSVPGATSYRIYGRGAYTTNNGQHNKAIYFTSATASFSDTGGAGTSGSPPRWDRESGNAPVVRLSAAADNFIGGPKPLGVGTYAPQAKVHIASPDAATVGQRIDLATAPTANAWEVRDSAGTVQAKVDNGFNLTAPRLIASATTGTAPLGVSSTTEVTNLNSQLWHGKLAIDFSASLDFGSIAPQSCAELSVTVTGASVNSAVAPAWPATLESGLMGVMYVSAADNLRVRLCNVTSASIDPSNQTFGGRVIK